MNQNSLKNLTYRFPKGTIPWNKGTKGVMKPNETSFKKGRRDEDHPEWKGDKVSYHGLHAWVARWKGKSSICEECGTTTASHYEWANISGKYKRDLSDWKRLCKKCHHRFDNISAKIWATRRAKQV